MKRYTLKVECKRSPDFYRILETDGTTKLSSLANSILNAVAFSRDRLYMFSTTRKWYDPDGYYAPGPCRARGEKSAARFTLDDLQLTARRKILFLYDFGDEWMFYITVKKITQTEGRKRTVVTESRGQLERHPDRDGGDGEDNWQIVFTDNEEKGWPVSDFDRTADGIFFSYGKFSIQELREILSEVLGDPAEDLKEGAAGQFLTKKNLRDVRSLDDWMPYSARECILDLADRVFSGRYINEHAWELHLLDSQRLVTISETGSGNPAAVLVIFITKELLQIARLLRPDERQIRRSAMKERYLFGLAQYYGAVELPVLRGMLREELMAEEEEKEIRKKYLRPLQRTDMLNVVEWKGETVVSLLTEEDTRYVMEHRKPDSDYKVLSMREKSRLWNGDWDFFLQETQRTLQKVADAKISPDFVPRFGNKLIRCCRVGLEKEEFYEYLAAEYQILGGENGEYAAQIEKTRKQFPAAMWKGYSAWERENLVPDGNRKKSFLDERLPF